MSFVCPTCDAPALQILDVVDLGPGDDDDERRMQLVRRSATGCGFEGAAEYTASRRGSGDSWHHDGMAYDAAGLATIKAWFAAAPTARSKIEGLRDLAKHTSYFKMRLAER